MNPATKAMIHATATALGDMPADVDAALGTPPVRGEGMTYHEYEAACRRWAKSARRYVCEACNKVHVTEYDAEQCCPPEIGTIYVDEFSGKEYCTASDLAKAVAAERAGKGANAAVPINACPVCGTGSTSPHEAVECCLWKDLAAPTRWAIATALELGSTWETELAKVEGGAA